MPEKKTKRQVWLEGLPHLDRYNLTPLFDWSTHSTKKGKKPAFTIRNSTVDMTGNNVEDVFNTIIKSMMRRRGSADFNCIGLNAAQPFKQFVCFSQFPLQ